MTVARRAFRRYRKRSANLRLERQRGSLRYPRWPGLGSSLAQCGDLLLQGHQRAGVGSERLRLLERRRAGRALLLEPRVVRFPDPRVLCALDLSEPLVREERNSMKAIAFAGIALSLCTWGCVSPDAPRDDQQTEGTVTQQLGSSGPFATEQDLFHYWNSTATSTATQIFLNGSIFYSRLGFGPCRYRIRT